MKRKHKIFLKGDGNERVKKCLQLCDPGAERNHRRTRYRVATVGLPNIHAKTANISQPFSVLHKKQYPHAWWRSLLLPSAPKVGVEPEGRTGLLLGLHAQALPCGINPD